MTDFSQFNDLDRLRNDYESGKLDHLKGDLEQFLVENREEIERIRREVLSPILGEDAPIAVAIKWFILRMRSINPAGDIKEQLQEIKTEQKNAKEKEGDAANPKEIATEWARLYSPGWRDHRVLSIVYVFDQDRDHFVTVYHNRGAGS